MNLGTKDIIYILFAAGGMIGTFYATINKVHTLIFDKTNELNKSINDLKIENEKLKSELALQKQIVEQFRTQVLDHLPSLYSIISNKGKNES